MYEQIYSTENLHIAFHKAKRGKTKKRYVKRFQKNLNINLSKLSKELSGETYMPCPRKTFTLRDPKTRKISKSAFRDRVVHHALCNLIVPKLEKPFIYDSHANQIGKGTLKAIDRFDKFKLKVSKNNTQGCYVLKADIKQYFNRINHEILLKIIKREITCRKTLNLISKILTTPMCAKGERGRERDVCGMPLGNLTSQFFANLYLNELDQFVKHKLGAKYYIRYVDDFVILHKSKEQLNEWKSEISVFLENQLKIELHPSKTHILDINSGINFLGFRIFPKHKLIRKSNLKNFERKFNKLRICFNEGFVGKEKSLQSLEGWLPYCSHANTFKYRKSLIKRFNQEFSKGSKTFIRNKKRYKKYVRRIDENTLQYSTQKTLYFHNNGLSIKEIALRQKVKESTIWKYIITLIEHRQIFLTDILPIKKIEIILDKIYGYKDTLRDIKNKLKDKATYDEIACVMASMRSKRKK